MNKYFFSLFLVVLTIPVFSYAHPGDTDVFGYHACRLGYYECAQWGVQYGVRHYHDSSYYVGSVTPRSNNDLEELFKDSKTYKNISNGFQIHGNTYCDEGYSEDDGECTKPKSRVLDDDNNSMSDPANNPRIRFVNSMQRGRYSNLEVMTEKNLNLYSEEILELVPEEKIKEYAPRWFVEKYLPKVNGSQTDSDREALLKQIEDLLSLVAVLQTQVKNQ